jgi:hypothetical protein
MTIIKIEDGFTLKDNNYLFESVTNEVGNTWTYEIIGESQVHVVTNQGIILLDLSLSIDDNFFTDINSFVNALYN